MGNFHAYPPADLVAHEITEDCVCIPSVRALHSPDGTDWLYTHHSLDGRERNERQS